MIPDAVVKRLARAQSVDPMIVDLDHALGVILWALSADTDSHAPRWVFKGGTCLRKAYYHDYRFSEDLDFTVVGPLTSSSVMDRVRKAAGVGSERGVVGCPGTSGSISAPMRKCYSIRSVGSSYTPTRIRSSLSARLNATRPRRCLPRSCVPLADSAGSQSRGTCTISASSSTEARMWSALWRFSLEKPCERASTCRSHRRGSRNVARSIGQTGSGLLRTWCRMEPTSRRRSP